MSTTRTRSKATIECVASGGVLVCDCVLSYSPLPFSSCYFFSGLGSWSRLYVANSVLTLANCMYSMSTLHWLPSADTSPWCPAVGGLLYMLF